MLKENEEQQQKSSVGFGNNNGLIKRAKVGTRNGVKIKECKREHKGNLDELVNSSNEPSLIMM